MNPSAPIDPIVIKLGTGILTQDSGAELDYGRLQRLVSSVAKVQVLGLRCILVSSGAVGAGMTALGLEQRPEDIPTLQACAAIGQCRLMRRYEDLFQEQGLRVAQLLLTHDDLETEIRRDRIRSTLNRLLQIPRVVPIINENDSVAVFELRFGDNDVLSARVAGLMRARQLLLLTTAKGLMPPDAKSPDDIVRQVDDIESVLHYARDEKGELSVGGMASKLRAAQEAVHAGTEVIIADGRDPAQLVELVNGLGFCTRFSPRQPTAAIEG